MITADDMSTWRVLIVDDEPDNLNVAGDFFEFSGAVVFRVNNGEAGLALFDQERPNLVLLDLAMPDMDGWEVHRRLRQHPAAQDVPIVALTALAMSTDMQRAKTEGFDGYITKPFRINMLVEQLRACIQNVTGRMGTDARTATGTHPGLQTGPLAGGAGDSSGGVDHWVDAEDDALADHADGAPDPGSNVDDDTDTTKVVESG